MINYTPEDFEKAEFAIDPSGKSPLNRCWMRAAETTYPWMGEMGRKARSDEQMAHAGCIPIYAEPYSPEALERAWEHGEKPKKGDVAEEGVSYIWLNGKGKCVLYADGSQSPLLPSERVVYRPDAPKPWADLAASLADALGTDDDMAADTARDLYEAGWRKVTDDE